MIGLAHDIGKCSAEFQDRLNGGSVVDHATAGAFECAKLDALWAACCVAGHHGGLPDAGNLMFSEEGRIPVHFRGIRKEDGTAAASYETGTVIRHSQSQILTAPVSLPRIHQIRFWSTLT